MKITKLTTTLEDGSNVFDVALTDGAGRVLFHAVTERDADQLIRTMRGVVAAHTNDELT